MDILDLADTIAHLKFTLASKEITLERYAYLMMKLKRDFPTQFDKVIQIESKPESINEQIINN